MSVRVRECVSVMVNVNEGESECDRECHTARGLAFGEKMVLAFSGLPLEDSGILTLQGINKTK